MVEYGGKVLYVPFRGDRIRSREAVSHRGRVFGLYRSAMFVFAPARSLDYARDDGAVERFVLFNIVRCRGYSNVR